MYFSTMPEYLSYQYPQYTLSERQDSILAEYDRDLEPNRYKSYNRSTVRTTSVFNKREFNNHLDFFCTMNSISVQDIKRHIQYLENQLIYHPIVPSRPQQQQQQQQQQQTQSRPHIQSRIEELEQRLESFPVVQNTKPICDICIEKPKQIAFRCGHVMCEECSPKLTICPTCRVPITDRIKLYM